MAIPCPKQLLAVAQRIDFDPCFRAAVDARPRDALTAAGLDGDTAMALVAGVEGDGVGDVVLFDAGAMTVAVRAHRLAMALLRQA